MSMTNCMLSANSSSTGGGVYNFGTLTIANSTLSGNSASIFGGGIVNSSDPATLTITNSTLTGNSVSGGSGGGIYNFGTVNSRSSIIAGNTASSGSNFSG